MERPFFSKKLRQRRRELDLTHEQVAEMLGMTRPSYSPYEQGRKYPAEKYQEPLANILNIPVLQLKAWMAIDEYGEEVARAICKELKIG